MQGKRERERENEQRHEDMTNVTRTEKRYTKGLHELKRTKFSSQEDGNGK